MAKTLIYIGIFFIIAGVAWMGLDQLGLSRSLGHLPGDIRFTRGSTSFYFPIVTCIVISVVLSIILNFFSRH